MFPSIPIKDTPILKPTPFTQLRPTTNNVYPMNHTPTPCNPMDLNSCSLTYGTGNPRELIHGDPGPRDSNIDYDRNRQMPVVTSRVLDQMHPEYRRYTIGQHFSNLSEFSKAALHIQAAVLKEKLYVPPPDPTHCIEPSLAFRSSRSRVSDRSSHRAPRPESNERGASLAALDPYRAKVASEMNKKIILGRDFLATSGIILDVAKGVSEGIVKPDPSNISSIEKFPTPHSVKCIQRFLGLCGFYRCYVKDFSLIAKPLTKLLRKNQSFLWLEKQQEAFNKLKYIMTHELILTLPDMDKEFVLSCDASGLGLGAVLQQEGEHGLRPIAFASRTLRPNETAFCISELECLSVVWATQKFMPFIECSHFKVETDHKALQSILDLKEPCGRLKRWAMRLASLNCTIIYRRGTQNLVADALSRAPIEEIDPPRETYVDSILPIHDEVRESLVFAPITTSDVSCSDHSCVRCEDKIVPAKTHKKTPSKTKPPNINTKVQQIPKTQTKSKSPSKFINTKQSPSERKRIQLLLSNVEEPLAFPKNSEDWAKAQRLDTNCMEIIRKLEQTPDNLSHYYLDAEQVLRRRNQNRASSITVPRHLRHSVLVMMHDHVLSGHLGVQKTLFRVKSRYSWPNLRQDVTEYVKGCLTCQRVKASNIGPYGFMDSRQQQGPGAAISCDLIGPLPKSPSGNEFALIVQDDFTRFPEIYPIRHATARAVVNGLLDYCCRYGFPGSARSDHGSQFAGRLWLETCARLGIKPRKTVVYRPQGNPTERINRTVKQCIKSYVDSHRDWDQHLSAIAFAIRSIPSDTTGFSPAALTFGRELSNPVDITEQPGVDEGAPTLRTTDQCSPEQYAQELTNRLQVALRIARDNCMCAKEIQSNAYNKGRRESPFQVGDTVLRSSHVLSDASKAICSSLVPRFEGPFVLKHQMGQNTFRLETPDGLPAGNRNIDQLRLLTEPPLWSKTDDDDQNPILPVSIAENVEITDVTSDSESVLIEQMFENQHT
ncbi:UNVERIFIED_CONTAM: hypothetical protein B566_EDAN019430, partial [Ephemera danica]